MHLGLPSMHHKLTNYVESSASQTVFSTNVSPRTKAGKLPRLTDEGDSAGLSQMSLAQLSP